MKLLTLLVFLSYGHSDRTVAERLRADLHQAGCRVWMDTDVRAGQEWTREIERAIDKSDTVVVLVSPAAARSSYVRAEVLRAGRKGKRIVPVVVQPGVDMPLPLEPLQWVSLDRAVSAVGCKQLP